MVTECDERTPLDNDAVVPPPAVNIPLEEISTVPLYTFGPLEHGLLFASRAVTLIVKGIPVICVPRLPPDDDSTRKLETAPPFTVNDELAGPMVIPSETVIEVVSAFFSVVVNIVDETPLAKLTEVTYDGAVKPFEGPL